MGSLQRMKPTRTSSRWILCTTTDSRRKSVRMGRTVSRVLEEGGTAESTETMWYSTLETKERRIVMPMSREAEAGADERRRGSVMKRQAHAIAARDSDSGGLARPTAQDSLRGTAVSVEQALLIRRSVGHCEAECSCNEAHRVATAK